MAFYGGGRNPVFGRDNGPPPPSNRPTYGYTQQFGYQPYPACYLQQQYYGGPYGQAPYMANNAAQATQFAPMGRGQGLSGNPIVNPSMPAANLNNSTGGVGCEPGYNYFFPSEHTKIHVFMTGSTAPWNLPKNFSAPFKAVHVPVNTKIGDLLKGFGATNPDPSKNRAIELHQGGNGQWYKGMSFKGDDFDHMGKDIKSVGWDKTRNGLPGGKPVVYLYVTKG